MNSILNTNGSTSAAHVSVSVVSWNVNGIRSACKKGFSSCIEEIGADIICLQEIRISQLQIAEVQVPHGYRAYWNSALRPGYSGTALLSRKKPVSVSYQLGYPELDEEGRTIIADFGEFVVINGYFPNGRSDHSRVPYKLRYYDAVITLCRYYLSRGRGLIVCGDLNTAHTEIDLAHPKANRTKTGFLEIERSRIDTLVKEGMIDTFRHFYPGVTGKYTWWSALANARERNTGWRFDYMFVAKQHISMVREATIFANVRCSDHCPVGIRLEPSIQPLSKGQERGV